MDPEYERRAAERRNRLRGGVARSFDDLDKASREFWRQATPEVKLQAMFDALVEAWILKGSHGSPPRFDGSTWGVLRHER